MYDNATKETWRGFAWNQVSERLKRVPGSQQRVCVLAGDIAADRECATKRGLECVAVDCNLSAVKNYRRAGGVAIQDRLKNQILTLQPHALIADLVSGITPEVVSMYWSALGLCDVVVFNLLRGRDKGIGDRAQELAEANVQVPEYTGRHASWSPIGKHRGRLLYIMGVAAQIDAYCKLKNISPTGVECVSAANRVTNRIADEMRPRFYSYRSVDSGQYFDTVVVTAYNNSKHADKLVREQIRNMAPKKSRQRTAAARAVLTRRQRLGEI